MDYDQKAAIKYQELLNKYGDTFTDWIHAKFTSTHSIFRFSASPKYALEIMNQFEKEHPSTNP